MTIFRHHYEFIMNCIIDNSIAYLLKQGKKAKAIKKYLRERYHISIDSASIRKRIETLRESGKVEASV